MPDTERVLVTGGAGFIGTSLCQAWLARGARVLAYDDFSANNKRILTVEHPSLHVHQGSVVDDAATRDVIVSFRPTILYHLAALHYIPACEKEPVRALSVNVIGTESVLLAAEEARVSCFVLASSAAVYAESDQAHIESDPTGPRDVYGLTKVFAEHLTRHFHARTQRTATICRFFNVYGPGDTIPHIIPELLNQCARGDGELHLGSVKPRRDFIAVDDVVGALVAIAGLRNGDCEVFNVGTGKDYSVREIVEILGSALGTNLRIISDESRVRGIDRLRLLADISKITDATGWKPRTDLRHGLMETLRAHPKLGTTRAADPLAHP